MSSQAHSNTGVAGEGTYELGRFDVDDVNFSLITFLLWPRGKRGVLEVRRCMVVEALEIPLIPLIPPFPKYNKWISGSLGRSRRVLPSPTFLTFYIIFWGNLGEKGEPELFSF